MASRQKSQRSSFLFKKTANWKTSKCTLMAQSPETCLGHKTMFGLNSMFARKEVGLRAQHGTLLWIKQQHYFSPWHCNNIMWNTLTVFAPGPSGGSDVWCMLSSSSMALFRPWSCSSLALCPSLLFLSLVSTILYVQTHHDRTLFLLLSLSLVSTIHEYTSWEDFCFLLFSYSCKCWFKK